MEGDVAHNMYPAPAVHQRLFNKLIQILRWLADSDLFGAFWWKPRATAKVCKMTVQ